MTQQEAPAALHEVASRLEVLAVRAYAWAERVGVRGRVDRPLVRGAEQVRVVDLLGLVVEDRRLDRAIEELVGVAAEELVQRVLACHVDGQATAATPGAAPHLTQARRRCRGT